MTGYATRTWNKQASGSPALRTSGVYIFRNEEDGLCKIGYSRDIDKRLHALQRTHNLRLTHVHTIACEDYYLTLRQLEREMHQRYADKRVKYEWFALSDEDIAAIRMGEWPKLTPSVQK